MVLVITARGQGLAIGTEGHALHGAGVAGEGWAQRLTPGHIPQQDDGLVVNPARGHGLAIGTEGYALHEVVVVAGEAFGPGAGAWPHPTEMVGVDTARGQGPAIGTEGHAHHGVWCGR